MRSLEFTSTGPEYWNQWAALCCSCGLCTLYACPEELFPKEACDQSKAELKKANAKWTGQTTVKPHPMRDGRRVPIKTLKKLHITRYEHPAPLTNDVVAPARIVLPLKQSSGSPGVAFVRAGDCVVEGQVASDVPEKALGAAVHAPFAATVVEVTAQHIVLTR
jgi:Na+-translocating ferredoxin:NAD+ oxidoreductase RnfC subunit